MKDKGILAALAVVLVYLLFFLCLRHPRENWDRLINSDGKGYYAYLPALFIYHDLQFSFVESYEAKYYPSDRSVFKEIRIPAYGKVVNKCFAGLAVLWLPFFLVAHLVSPLLGFPADGYSLPYQYAILVAGFFYLFLALALLHRILKTLGARSGVAAFITLLTGLGTNLIYYTILEGSMTHVYSFFLVTLFAFSLTRLNRPDFYLWIISAFVSLAIIVLIRPVNLLVLCLVPVFIPSGMSIADLLLKNVYRRSLLAGVLLFLLLVLIQPVIWYVQTGHFLVYSYGNESFDFKNPYFFSILFSTNRGWFIYTPIALVSLAGLVPMLRKNGRMFLGVVIFLLIFTYVASCWWMWYYASKFGQRVFIDFYCILAVLLFFLLQSVDRRKMLKTALWILLTLLAGFNLVQFYQHAKWIFPPGYITREIYWDSFFTLHPLARVYLPEEAIIRRVTYKDDMENDNGWGNPETLTGEKAFSGKKSSVISAERPYSPLLSLHARDLFSGPNAIIRIRARVFQEKGRSSASLVVDFGKKDQSLCYNAAYLGSYARKERWTPVDFAFYKPRELPDSTDLKIYFYNPSPDPLYIDDMVVDILTLKDMPDYRKIEGILLPPGK